jgi:hypothetical protein
MIKAVKQFFKLTLITLLFFACSSTKNVPTESEKVTYYHKNDLLVRKEKEFMIALFLIVCAVAALYWPKED